MAAAAPRYDFDLVLAANFGGSGEIVETVASHLASLAGRSWRIGLWRLADSTRPVAALSPRIAAFARGHTAVPIPPDASGIRSRLVLIYEPSLLALPDAPTFCVRADCRLVILVQSPANRSGPVFDVTLAAARIDAGIAVASSGAPPRRPSAPGYSSAAAVCPCDPGTCLHSSRCRHGARGAGRRRGAARSWTHAAARRRAAARPA